MPRATLHNRQDSLERALQLFWRKGFHATSLKDLEKALDMRPGSIYAAFGSKDALFQESLERYARMALRELQRTLSGYDSPLLGLAAYLRQLGKLSEQELSCRACQADVMGLRAFAQRDVCSSSVHALAEDMAQSIEDLRS